MEKKYVLIMELKSKIDEQFPVCLKEDRVHLQRFMKELLKRDDVICRLNRLMLLEDIISGSHLYELGDDFETELPVDEIEILAPVLAALPKDSQEFFRQAFDDQNAKKDNMLELILGRFDILRVSRLSFFEADVDPGRMPG
jgi:hypothetical protein